MHGNSGDDTLTTTEFLGKIRYQFLNFAIKPVIILTSYYTMPLYQATSLYPTLRPDKTHSENAERKAQANSATKESAYL